MAGYTWFWLKPWKTQHNKIVFNHNLLLLLLCVCLTYDMSGLCVRVSATSLDKITAYVGCSSNYSVYRVLPPSSGKSRCCRVKRCVLVRSVPSGGVMRVEAQYLSEMRYRGGTWSLWRILVMKKTSYCLTRRPCGRTYKGEKRENWSRWSRMKRRGGEKEKVSDQNGRDHGLIIRRRHTRHTTVRVRVNVHYGPLYCPTARAAVTSPE